MSEASFSVPEKRRDSGASSVAFRSYLWTGLPVISGAEVPARAPEELAALGVKGIDDEPEDEEIEEDDDAWR